MSKDNGVTTKADPQVVSGARIIEIKKESQQVEDPFLGKDIAASIKPPFDMSALADLHTESTWHFRCVKIKADLITGLGFEVVGVDKEDQKEDDEFRRVKEWMETPNDEGDLFEELMSRFWTDYEAIGNAYLELDRNGKGEVQNIYHVPGFTMRRLKEKPGFVQVRGNKTQEFRDFRSKARNNQNEIIHLKSYYLKSDHYGIPDFLPALSAATLDRFAQNYNINFFDNATMIAMALVVEGGELDDPSIKVVTDFLRNKAKGVDNAHKMLYLPTKHKDVKIKFEKLAAEIRDYSFRMMRMDNRDEIIAAHGVPPRMMGITMPGTLGVSHESYSQLQTFKILTVDRRQRRLAHMLNMILREGMGIKKWKIKPIEMDITNRRDDAEFAHKLGTSGILSLGESRTAVGFPEQMPDGSVSPTPPAAAVTPDLEKLFKATVELRETMERYIEQ